MRIINDPDQAEEIVEDAFWQARHQAHRYEGELAPWLPGSERMRGVACRIGCACAGARASKPWWQPPGYHASIQSAAALARASDPARGAENTDQRERVARTL
jgi:hypothetical protein